MASALSALPSPPTLQLTCFQAHRIITQVVVTGGRVLGRAFTEAYKQAQATQKYVAAGSRNPGVVQTAEASGLTLDEACKILDVPQPKRGRTDMERVMERFKRLFDSNESKNGGSFYLQSKILRARMRIEAEVRSAELEREAKVEKEWRPKFFKDEQKPE
jgi:import inner membrane translocase subunit TIM16